jgi:type III secretory pathway component EscT
MCRWKSVVLSNTNWLGGRNPFLGVVYIVTGGMSFVLGVVYLMVAVIKPRKFADVSRLQ